MKWSGRLFLFLFLSACGGAPAKGSAPVTHEAEPPPPPAPSLTLAVLPVSAQKYPRLGAALDHALQAARVNGAESHVSSVSLDVVQLSIECVERTPACYAAVARSLKADQLLFARVEPGTNKQVKVEVTRTDAAGSTLGSAGATYHTEDDGAAEAQMLVGRAVGGGNTP